MERNYIQEFPNVFIGQREQTGVVNTTYFDIFSILQVFIGNAEIRSQLAKLLAKDLQLDSANSDGVFVVSQRQFSNEGLDNFQRFINLSSTLQGMLITTKVREDIAKVNQILLASEVKNGEAWNFLDVFNKSIELKKSEGVFAYNDLIRELERKMNAQQDTFCTGLTRQLGIKIDFKLYAQFFIGLTLAQLNAQTFNIFIEDVNNYIKNILAVNGNQINYKDSMKEGVNLLKNPMLDKMSEDLSKKIKVNAPEVINGYKNAFDYMVFTYKLIFGDVTGLSSKEIASAAKAYSDLEKMEAEGVPLGF